MTPDAMLYARLASGYQAGGVNTTPGVQPGYAPSKTKDYEIGFKGDALDHVLSFDASVYYIDWIDLQLLICPPQHLCFNGNAGGAKSEGVELSVEAHPLAGLTVSTWVTYSDAAITKFPPDAIRGGVYASPGDRLPFTPRWSANLSVVDEFPISGSFTGFAGGTMSYVGARDGGFTGTATQQRQLYRSYNQLNARIGVKRDSWTATLFATNVTDQRGELGGNQLTPNAPDIVQIIRPRQMGLSLSKSF
jgi:outer membrane receptor protein involved in Fe transport